MKKTLKTIAILALCAIMAAIAPLSALAADGDEEGFVPYDYEKFMAFLNQESGVPGYTNEQVIIKAHDDMVQHLIDIGQSTWLSEDQFDYAGGIYAPIFRIESTSEGLDYVRRFDPYFVIPTGWYDWTDIVPDLGGDLDVSGTMIEDISGAGVSTHITSVIANDCPNLRNLQFNWQDYCTSVSVRNCPNLSHIMLRGYAFRHLYAELQNHYVPFVLDTIGNGSFWVLYEYGELTLSVSDREEDRANFLGWFKNGQRMNNAYDFVYKASGQVYACFAGDVNGDDAINMADAVLISRAAMSIIDVESVQPYDTNANGTIDVADAVIAARIGLGA